MPPIDFNPRSREGSDCKSPDVDGHYCEFQSTLPRRERHITSAAAAGLAHFNPRSREGSDVAPVVHGRWVFISIHAPAKGATLPPYHEHPRQAISIHAPVKGATLPSLLSQRKRGISIHAPVKGATYYRTDKRDQEEISIHAPVKGATVNIVKKLGRKSFQSTLP